MTWFSRLGAPLDAGDREAIHAYLAALGLGEGTPVRLAGSWAEAASLCTRDGGAWWEREEAERRRLAALVQLNDHAIIRDSEAAMSAARDAKCEDAATAYAASGAATLAAHEARLARAAGAGDEHVFMRKLALYEAGRWPLGVYGGEFAIF